jgi:ubiquinone/menaquinone biosynthesis C-methylase UbiE
VVEKWSKKQRAFAANSVVILHTFNAVTERLTFIPTGESIMNTTAQVITQLTDRLFGQASHQKSPAGVQDQPDINTIKAKMKASWEDGDYAAFAKFMEDGAIEVVDGWGIQAGQHLLDIACGSGQTALPAARKGALVTGVDIAQNLIEHANRRASFEGLDAHFDVGDAELLPYDDTSFDVLITMFGAMFAPRPEKVAAELARVCKPGGKLIMANWTSTSMPAQMFKCVAGHTPPPAGVVPPVLWGDEDIVTSRLEENFKDIKLTRKIYPQWHYPFSAAGVVELFRTYFGPVKRAFDVLDGEGQKLLHEQLEYIYTTNGDSDGRSITITGGEYLEVVATRR